MDSFTCIELIHSSLDYLTSSLGWAVIWFMFGFVIGRVTLKLDKIVVQLVTRTKKE